MIRHVQDLEVIERSVGLKAETLSIELTESLRLLPGRREVYGGRLEDPQAEVVVKCYWPHAKQTRDWNREWTGLIALSQLKLPAPEPLAVCRGVDQKVYVIMRRVSGADALGAYLEQADAHARAEVMQRMAQLVDLLHRVGARQKDQHIDNWAVAGGDLYLLDAGTYQFSSAPLGSKARLADLAAICVTLPPPVERLFRASLREVYWLDAMVSCSDLLGQDLDAAIIAQQGFRARRYYKKTQRSCTEFSQRSSAVWRGMFARGTDADLLAELFADPDALMQQGTRLKAGNTCTVQSFRVSNQTYVLKRYNTKPWPTRLRRSLFASRARKSWSSAWLLKLAFIPTAEPVAFLEEKGFPLSRSFLLMREVKGDLLPEYLKAHGQDAALVDSVVAGVGQVWDSLGRLRAAHGDLKASNWMVDASGRVLLFDLDAFRFGLSDRAFKRGREKDLHRFLKNWKAQPEWAEAFRARMEGDLSR